MVKNVSYIYIVIIVHNHGSLENKSIRYGSYAKSKKNLIRNNSISSGKYPVTEIKLIVLLIIIHYF